MGLFYRYEPLDMNSLKQLLQNLEKPHEIRDDPIIRERNESFSIIYKLWEMNPYGDVSYPHYLFISIKKKWNDYISVRCKDIVVEEMLRPYFVYKFRYQYTQWNKKPRIHGLVGTEWADRANYQSKCGICHEPGKYKGHVCSSCTKTKMRVHRNRKHLRTIKREIERQTSRIKLLKFLLREENQVLSDTQLTRILVNEDVHVK